jgi:hypothetical protein
MNRRTFLGSTIAAGISALVRWRPRPERIDLDALLKEISRARAEWAKTGLVAERLLLRRDVYDQFQSEMCRRMNKMNALFANGTECVVVHTYLGMPIEASDHLSKPYALRLVVRNGSRVRTMGATDGRPGSFFEGEHYELSDEQFMHFRHGTYHLQGRPWT